MKLAILIATFTLAVRADSIVVTFTNANQFTSPGTNVTFTANAFNLLDVPVNLVSYSAALDAPLTLDDTYFLLNWFSIPAMSNFHPLDQPLFEIAVPDGTPAGVYNGSFTFLGGPEPTDQEILGGAAFTVTVDTAVPEPAGWSLTGIGLLGLFAFRQKLAKRRLLSATVE